MNYLEVITELHLWLKKLQVTQKHIVADLNGDNIKFTLFHPIKGIIAVEQTLPEKKFFQSYGIALQIKNKTKDKVEMDVYDFGGIFDPLDKRVQGEHYSTMHFALLSAILYSETKEDSYLDCTSEAMDFHFRTSKDEYYFSNWEYHWDFKNFALVEIYSLLKEVLNDFERRQWEECIKSWRANTHNLTNWNALRAYAYLFRSRLRKSKFDAFKSWKNYQFIRKSQLADGGIADEKGKSSPIQYHLFTVALLHRMYLMRKSEEDLKRFLAGLKFFINFIDPEGDFNYYGRGHEQIFGYGIALYILEAAKLVDVSHCYEYQYWIDKVWNYLLRFKKADGHFPLVLNHRQDQEKYGWYDYHHLTVYNAFLGAWLGLAHILKTEKVLAKDLSSTKTVFFKQSQFVTAGKDEYFLAINGGVSEYLSEASLTFQHLYFKEIGYIYSCPGGPDRQRFGKINVVENVEKNYFAPIALDSDNNWITPALKRGEILTADSDQIKVVLNYGHFLVERTVYLKNRSIVISDDIHFKEYTNFKEFRYFNFPIVIDKFKIEITDGKICLVKKHSEKKVSIKFLKNSFANGKIERLDNIKTAKGLAIVVSLRERGLSFENAEKRIVKYQINRN